MKKMLYVFVYVVTLFAVASCTKDRNCRCTIEDVDEHATVTSKEVIMNVDGSMKCESVKVVGDEWMSRLGFERSRNTVSCTDAD